MKLTVPFFTENMAKKGKEKLESISKTHILFNNLLLTQEVSKVNKDGFSYFYLTIVIQSDEVLELERLIQLQNFITSLFLPENPNLLKVKVKTL